MQSMNTMMMNTMIMNMVMNFIDVVHMETWNSHANRMHNALIVTRTEWAENNRIVFILSCTSCCFLVD